jgi:hypothetical protein
LLTRSQISLVVYKQPFVEAMLSFVGYLISTQTGGNMVFSAGVVPVLVTILSSRQPSQMKVSWYASNECVQSTYML